ncbi:hypothetical protein PSPL106493_19540 [Pseudomonas plecoglossicida]
MIKTGDRLPDVTLYQYSDGQGGCPLGPQAWTTSSASR